MSSFLRLLPSDLHLDILSLWISDKEHGAHLLVVLSNLDIALPKADKRTFRSLLSRLPQIEEWNSNKAIKWADKFMAWLQSRNVRVQMLMLCDSGPTSMTSRVISFVTGMFRSLRPLISLPTVTVINITVYPQASNEVVERALRGCPNVTKLDGHMSTIPTFTPELVALVPNLKTLCVSGYVTLTVASIQAIGPHLHELRFVNGHPNDELLTAIGKSCPLLKIFQLSTNTSTFPLLLGILQACPFLTEIVWNYLLTRSDDDLGRLLEVKQIRKLSLTTRFVNSTSFYTDRFAVMLARRPDLDLFQMGDCKYVRSERLLHLCEEHFENFNDEINTILDMCADLSDLHLGKPLWYGTSPILVEKIGSYKLHSLTLSNPHAIPLSLVLQRCGQLLRKLRIVRHSSGPVSMMLGVIATNCPALECFTIEVSYQHPVTISASDIANLFLHCPQINELGLVGLPSPQTLSVLQAFLDHRIRLRKLALVRCGCGETDVEWFEAQAKALQLLPVAHIAREGVDGWC